MVHQCTFGVSTEDEYKEDDEDDESYEYCVVMVEDLDYEDNEDLYDEDNV